MLSSSKYCQQVFDYYKVDELTLYGQKVCSLDVRKKCEELFWHRVLMEDNSFELNRKNAMYRRRILVEKIKTEGEKNE